MCEQGLAGTVRGEPYRFFHRVQREAYKLNVLIGISDLKSAIVPRFRFAEREQRARNFDQS
jgi:hypothetical protein